MTSRNVPAATPGKAGRRTPPLAVLGVALLFVGLLLCLGFVGTPRLLGLAETWRHFLGWAGLPAALALVWAGVVVWTRRNEDPWGLPWGRLLALEVAVLAGLTLVAAASGAEDGGPGGLAGRATAEASTTALGRPAAILTWLLLGSLALLALFRVGAAQLSASLRWLAESLAEDAPPGAASAAIKPRAPGGRASASPSPASDPSRPGTAASAAARAPAPPSTQLRGRVPSAPAAAPPPDLPASPPPTVTTYAADPRKGAGRAPRRPAHLPGLELLDDEGGAPWDEGAARAMARRIEEVLAGFGAPVRVAAIERGPTVTRFGLQPGTVERGGATQRVKVAQIKALKDDLALALAVRALRIEAPVAGRAMVGVEVPNPESGDVRLKGLLQEPEVARRMRAGGLTLALGRDVTGSPVLADLTTLPHALIAGTTGSGKSVCLHAILASLLFQASPDRLRLVVVDPKRVELVRYRGLPHLVAPVVTDVAEAIGALRWVIARMDERYRRFEAARVRDRTAYNSRLKTGEAPMAALVVVVDELADLMLTAPEEVEPAVTRLAQLGRAAGVHLVVATQRPSTDVVTGLIKANFPARIAFAVASGVDSRVILDQMGAESLLGRGDLLFQPSDAPQPVRAQGTYVSDDELGRLVGFWAASHWQAPTGAAPWTDLVPTLDPEEAMFEEALKLARRHPAVSASFLQRRLHVGYARAKDLFDRLVDEGVVDEDGRNPELDLDADEDLDWVDQEYERGD